MPFHVSSSLITFFIILITAFFDSGLLNGRLFMFGCLRLLGEGQPREKKQNRRYSQARYTKQHCGQTQFPVIVDPTVSQQAAFSLPFQARGIKDRSEYQRPRDSTKDPPYRGLDPES
jgi:hypothetical protein